MGAVDEFKKASTTTKIVIVVVAIILIFIAFNYLKGRKEAVKGFLNNRSEQDVLRENGIVETSNKQFYQSVADDLYIAMDGPQTDEDAIYDAFEKLKNDADVLAVEREFGLRDSSWNPFDSPVDLRNWIKDDLDAEEIANLNSLLRTKGITKTF